MRYFWYFILNMLCIRPKLPYNLWKISIDKWENVIDALNHDMKWDRIRYSFYNNNRYVVYVSSVCGFCDQFHRGRRTVCISCPLYRESLCNGSIASHYHSYGRFFRCMDANDRTGAMTEAYKIRNYILYYPHGLKELK